MALQSGAQNLKYPGTKTVNNADTLHEVVVQDPYRWLENITSEEVQAWVAAQNELSSKQLKKYRNRHNTINKMNRFMATEMRNSSRELSHNPGSNSYYRLFYNDEFGTPAIYHKTNSFNDYRLLVAPRQISSKDVITFQNFQPSKDDKYLAYQYSRNGSDWGEIRIASTLDANHPKDVITGVKFSDINWYDNGFFYKKYPFNGITDINEHPKLFYHTIHGEEDSLVFQSSNPRDELWLQSNTEETMYFLRVSNDFTSKNTMLYFDPSESIAAFRPLFYKVNFDLSFIDYHDNHFYFYGILKDRRQIIKINKSAPSDIHPISPTYEGAVLTDHEFMDQTIALSYQALSTPFLTIIDRHGQILKEVKLPAGVTIDNLTFQPNKNGLSFTMQSFTIPPTTCLLDLDSYEYKVVESTGVNFNFDEFRFSQEYITSKDGVQVPVFLVFKNQLKQSGNTPFLLKAYGGFGAISTPYYDPKVIHFVESGGVFAFVNIRGGGELGPQWWKSGILHHKQKGFDDFISAAEHFIDKGYTRPDKIGITGSSHGGLVAGAALTQRPELFGAALLNVAVLDMIRFEQFTVGTKHVDEFGTVSDSLDFQNLLAYSPYHNLKPVNHPPVLITTGDNDDRVPPLHAYKFAAALQNLPQQKNPVLLYTRSQAGHQGEQSRIDRLYDYALFSAFFEEHLFD